jgi:hypothetical protein
MSTMVATSRRRCRDAEDGRSRRPVVPAQPQRQPQPHGSVDSELPLRIPFRAEKQGKGTKVPGKADGTRGKGKGVVNAATAASALSSTQYNTVRVADAMQRLSPCRALCSPLAERAPHSTGPRV